MFKITNLETLGTTYKISDEKGRPLSSVQVIYDTDILDVALGPYTEDMGTFKEYLEKSISMVTGFKTINPEEIYWYSTYENEVMINDIIEFALENGYTKIILEYLDDLEEFEE